MNQNKELIERLQDYASNPGYSHGDYADTMRQAATALAATSSISPPAASESVDEQEMFEVAEIAYWQSMQDYPLTEGEKDYLLRPANSILAAEGCTYAACEERWKGWKARAKVAANKPAALAVQGDAVPVATMEVAYNRAKFSRDVSREDFQAGWDAAISAHPSPTPAPVTGEKVANTLPEKWVAKHYTGDEDPIIKSDGIELQCAGADREQAEEIAAILNAHTAAQVAASKPAESGQVSCLCGASGAPADAFGDAVAMWNRRAALPPVAAPVVPDGWKLVPVEPTDDMAFATTHVNNTLDRDDVLDMLRAAIEAAPQPGQDSEKGDL